jgi:hypothetical protein
MLPQMDADGTDYPPQRPDLDLLSELDTLDEIARHYEPTKWWNQECAEWAIDLHSKLAGVNPDRLFDSFDFDEMWAPIMYLYLRNAAGTAVHP